MLPSTYMALKSTNADVDFTTSDYRYKTTNYSGREVH